MFCKNCGNALPDSAIFCTECGNPVETHAVPQQPAYTPPIYQTQSKPQKKKGGWLLPYRIISSVLAVALIITGSYGVATRGGNGNNSAFYFEDLKDAYIPKDEPIPVTEGNSKAFSITPVEGLKISAEKNALDKDRQWNVSLVSDELFNEYAEYLSLHGGIAVEMYEIDAGLSDNEYFPGLYNMEFDLDYLEVPEELDYLVSVIRINGDGVPSELFSYIEGRKLICESDQNSLTVVVLGLGLGALLYWKGEEAYENVKDMLKDEKFYDMKEKTKMTVDGKTIYAMGEVYIPRDEENLKYWEKKRYLYTFSLKGNPVFEKELTDMMDEYRKAEADADAIMQTSWYRRRNSVLSKILAGTEAGYKTKYARWRECGDNLFGKNRKEFEKKCLVGVDLDAVLAIEAANEYFSKNLSVEFRPRRTIDVIMLDKIPNSSASALTVNPYTAAPYVQLSKEEFTNFRDSSFVTTGHEILHVWQAYAVYIDSLSYNSFWEAHARYFEREYTDWLCDTKKLIETKPNIDRYGKNYEYLAFGSEYMPGYWDAVFGDTKKLNTASQDYGYTRSRFFHWLEDNKGSAFSLSSMIHSYRSSGTFYGATEGGDLYKKINNSYYNKFYVEWCQSIAGEMYDKFGIAGEVYKTLNIIPVSADEKNPKTTISYKKIPNLSSFIQQFQTPENEYAWILVKTGEEACAMNPYHVMGIYSPAGYQTGENKKAAVLSGMNKYYFAGNLDPEEKPKTNSLYIQFTTLLQIESADLSFDAYLLTKPDPPGVVFEADGSCVLTFPEKSVSLEEKATDGYRIVIEDEKGKIQTIDVLTDNIETPFMIDKNKLGKGAVKISVCEYSKINNAAVGPCSTPVAKATVKIEGDRVIEYKPEIISEDEPVRHTFTAVAAPEDTYDFAWDFGDGEKETEEGVSFSYVAHEYKSEGNYNPTVTLYKDGKELAKDTVSIKIGLNEDRLIYNGTMTTTGVDLKGGDAISSPETVGEVRPISFTIDITNEKTGACAVTMRLLDESTAFSGKLTDNSSGGRHFEATISEGMGKSEIWLDISSNGKQLTGKMVLSAELFGFGSTCTYSLECDRQ